MIRQRLRCWLVELVNIVKIYIYIYYNVLLYNDITDFPLFCIIISSGHLHLYQTLATYLLVPWFINVDEWKTKGLIKYTTLNL